jgi:acylphosphatase
VQNPVALNQERLQNWPSMVLHFLIRGRVQGVGFRWYVHREASELDLRGWVRNTEDGDVEVVASGPVEDLAEYLDESEAARLSAFRIDGAW